MTREVRPFRWDRVPTVERRERALLAALVPGLPRPGELGASPWPELGPMSATPRPIRARDAEEIARQLGDPYACVLRLSCDEGEVGYAVVPAALAMASAARWLGAGARDAEPPRPPTEAERGVCALAAAALLARYSVGELRVEPWDGPPSALRGRLGHAWAACLELVVELAGVRGTVRIALPARAADRARRSPVATLLATAGARLEGASLRLGVVSGSGRLPRAGAARLARRDVVLLDDSPRSDRGRLQVGRGSYPVAVSDAGVELVGAYEPGEAAMDDGLTDDITVQVTCQLGVVTMTARQVLELAPGSLLTLDRATGDPVDLVVGDRVIGRGELVDVEGELGIRVLSLTS